MQKSRNETNLSQENQAARELGISIARDFERVVETFTRVLQYKEKIGQGLENEIVRVGQQAKSHREELEGVNHEIELHTQGLNDIQTRLGECQMSEKRLVEQYQRLLKGANRLEDAQEDNEASGDSGAMLREKLLKQKENFLERMQSSFKQLDEELLSTTSLKDELEKTRVETEQKKEQALQRKQVLEATGHRLMNNLESYARELETSIDEERILVDEFTKMIKNVEGCVTLSEEIDRVLFSSLDAAEGPGAFSQPSGTGFQNN
ncbi:MAG: hypothetical protein JSU88_04605 [Nitrospinaceae bacterium]|jgi:chromosome segregation ATPase|nr:MAG: hypothetical protein JSU88_04605 [Nitrospinaceae bacterium]